MNSQIRLTHKIAGSPGQVKGKRDPALCPGKKGHAGRTLSAG
jgi:hypothetical protein